MKTHLLFIAIIFYTIIGCIKNNEPNSKKSSSESIKEEDSSHELPFDSRSTVDTKYSTQQLDNTNGLSNSSVNAIFQDSENLLWIGTWDGLNRYDGSSFKIFRPGSRGSVRS